MVRRTLTIACGVLVASYAPALLAETTSGARLRAAVVLDASMSMSRQDPDQLAIVAARLLVDLGTAADELTLIEFGTKARTLGRRRVTDRRARKALTDALAGAAREEWCTDYRVGLRAALDALGAEAHPGERRLIIFLTDGLFDPDRSNESYYTTDEGRALLEKARRQKAFPERPCARSYKRLVQHVEEGFLRQMETLTADLRSSGVRLYTVGLGSDLASPSAEATRSRELLRRLASSTGGAFLVATEGAQLPRFFASIYSALVGAPVEDPIIAPPDADEVAVEVLRGAERVAIVADAAGDRTLELSASGPSGPARSFELRAFNTDTDAADGYRLIDLEAPPPGTWKIRRVAGSAPMKVQVIQEVGLKLVLSGLPPVTTEGTEADVTVALRSSAGDPVRLSPEFLGQIDVTASLGREGEEIQERTLHLDSAGEAAVGSLTLAPGRYVARASARHRLGLLDVAPVEAHAEVIHQLDLAFEESRLAFDVMAEDDAPPLSKGVKIALTQGTKLPIEQEFLVSWDEVEGLDLLDHGPTKVTLGPKRRAVDVTVSLREPRKLRDRAQRFAGKVWLRPVEERLYRGEPRWPVVVVDGRLRPWDWRRWYQEYALWIWSGLGAFLLLLWLIGRLVASKWPKKAKLHYIDLEDRPPVDMTVWLRKKSRSRLPFRSDRHHCGRGGAPRRRSKTRYCTLVASGRGFCVIPRDASVVVVADGPGDEDEPRRKKFKGKWEERYRLGDRYEIWLTRT